jgi:hypothetical protein
MSFFWNLSQQLWNIPPEVYSATLFGFFALDITSNIRFPRYKFGGADKKLKTKKLLSTKGKLPFYFFRMRHYAPYAYISGLYALRWTVGIDFLTDWHVLTVLIADACTAINTFIMHQGQWTRELGWDGQSLYVQEGNVLDDYEMRLSEVKFGGACVSMLLLTLSSLAKGSNQPVITVDRPDNNL